MFHHLTLAVRDRVIKELRDYWKDHPRYPDLAKNIQGKYSFDERPQFGMVVRTGGASNVVLSVDNFLGTLEGYVSLASFPNKPFGSIEWVREDPYGVREPGVYHITVSEGVGPDPTVTEYDFYLQKYLRVVEDPVTFSTPTKIMLSGTPIEGSLRIIEYPSGRYLDATEYSLEGAEITLTEVPSKAFRYKVLYTEISTQSGPYRVRPSTAYREIIPGVVLAIGRRLRAGDEMAVLVSETREEVAHEFGGRWDVSVEMDLIARDVHSQADISDQTAVWIWSSLRPRLANLGIELSDVSLGGESEEAYDDNGDDYFYTANISFSLQTDWFLHMPLVVPINSISQQGIELVAVTAPVVGAGSTTELVQRLM